ncbi:MULTISPECIES: AAA family ATPase [Pseudomonas]|uniref:Dynein-related subfamily AAA family protein n=1 Tax=Pseudomonas tolaasii NCPPB 2192 TaxID=564423 RepID=A0ABX4QPB4_PSETO|nr:AAA family ATPase [Pseudomonas tolaasii]KAB0470595.1 AAA family ATPase [Pseudomonas tolaasii]NWC28892.1 AAA family ATPase [Pseudomonas tolaasii]NWC40372.1 AAA family ATPase [Pseudomonas tolaasii]PKA78683.1 dynein-related subfamily AAA family protein [Pseudomonas tolaasii NCPPB 2192]
MAKNNRNSPYSAQIGGASAPAKTANRVQLEKQVPMWSASFGNASKLYTGGALALDFSVDEAFLSKLVAHISDDDSKAFSTWIERFAQFCKDLGKRADTLLEEYEERWELTNQAGRKCDARMQQLDEREVVLGVQSEAQTLRQAEFERVQQRQAQADGELAQREREVMLREVNAESGFAEQNRQALMALEERQRVLGKQHDSELGLLQEEKKALNQELRQLARQLADVKFRCTEAEAARAEVLDTREDALAQREQQVEDITRRLNREWAAVKEAKANQQDQVAREMEQERDGFARELERVGTRERKAWAMVDKHAIELSELQLLKAQLGDQSATVLLDELSALREGNRMLRTRLDQSDAAQLQDDVDELRRQLADRDKQIADILPLYEKSKREVSMTRVAATDLESSERQRRVLEVHKTVLDAKLSELATTVEQLTKAQKTQTPFPAMSLMDTHKDYRAGAELEDVPALGQFAVELQHRIATAETSVHLFYPIEDIRVLLGGLAMSQLHVFQGISGTGKTSLAKAFAKAMGGFCTDIAVQAGWRDRDDLLGHYNAFERRFYEKDCLQALYKAQTPRWEDACNVVLLDEMNLSRPEQYFSEFLSALEKNDPNERLISLSETELPGAPLKLKNGREILVPNNVWFIGTANHDESTSELADKTYDRAHVMTLPKQDAQFDILPYEKKRYSFFSLYKTFNRACLLHEPLVKDLLGRLTRDEFTQQLASHFDLGWGNRFEKQALRFIPVMLETGASEGQALDHLLSTRVMRRGKVTGRYDVGTTDVTELMRALENFWKKANLKGDPTKSLDLLAADIKRREGHR